MPSRTKYDAGMLLITAKGGMLGDDVLQALKWLAGFSFGSPQTITEETIHKLDRLSIARKEVNAIDGKDVLLLTNFGRKVIAVMKENPNDFGAAHAKGEDGF